MDGDLLTTGEAARRLGLATTTLYDWLGRSDRGSLVIRGQRATLNYFQTGPKGQGRIHIATAEVERLQQMLRVEPVSSPLRRAPVRRITYPGITVPLGRPS